MWSLADNPRKVKKKENSFLLHTISKYVVIDYAKGLLNDVELLGEENKNAWINRSSHATVAILLYEFASGNGPAARYFYDEHPFTKEIRTGPAMRYVLHEYVQDSLKPITDLRYQFSPLYVPFKPGTWRFGFREHYRTLHEENLSQFMLGSFNASVEFINGQHLVHIWNTTSHKSLFWGLGKRIQRPLPYGNIEQHIYLLYSDDEVTEMATEYTSKF